MMLWLEKRKLQLKNLYRIMSAYCPRVIFTLHLAFQHAIEGRFCCMYSIVTMSIKNIITRNTVFDLCYIIIFSI